MAPESVATRDEIEQDVVPEEAGDGREAGPEPIRIGGPSKPPTPVERAVAKGEALRFPGQGARGMGRGELYTPERVAAVLKETLGIVSHAARRLGVSTNTIQRYIRRHDACREAAEEGRAQRIDVAELALHKAVLNGEPWAIRFTLATIGGHRGFVERREVGVGGIGGGPIQLEAPSIRQVIVHAPPPVEPAAEGGTSVPGSGEGAPPEELRASAPKLEEGGVVPYHLRAQAAAAIHRLMARPDGAGGEEGEGGDVAADERAPLLVDPSAAEEEGEEGEPLLLEDSENHHTPRRREALSPPITPPPLMGGSVRSGWGR